MNESRKSHTGRDCLIVGGGPAGLTAAIYLARFHLSVTVIDAGSSRAKHIPMTHNHAGFPDGISGEELLLRMRAQAAKYGAELKVGIVEGLKSRPDGSFAVECKGATIVSRAVLLATGVVNRRPPMIDDRTHELALAGGQLRYCPVCDGYEVTDQDVAVFGTGRRGVEEALFLRSYTSKVTLVAPQAHDLTPEQRDVLAAVDIRLAGPCAAIRLLGQRVSLTLPDGVAEYDCLYPALGSDIQSDLARRLDAGMSEDGCLRVDPHQRTSVAGLYAAGDVVLGLDQISHAMGEGGVAATTIRNDLARQTPLLR